MVLGYRARMRYADFGEIGVPLGSGAVESMIRQVINLRLKGCGKFWKRENAERMLLLRSSFVTGRLDALYSRDQDRGDRLIVSICHRSAYKSRASSHEIKSSGALVR